jgi:hypothetical protein
VGLRVVNILGSGWAAVGAEGGSAVWAWGRATLGTQGRIAVGAKSVTPVAPADNRSVPTLIQPSCDPQVRICVAASLRVGAVLHGGRAAAQAGGGATRRLARHSRRDP